MTELIFFVVQNVDKSVEIVSVLKSDSKAYYETMLSLLTNEDKTLITILRGDNDLHHFVEEKDYTISVCKTALCIG